MSNGFPRAQVDQLLVKCHRRCCICHRFCGTKIETDHIDQRAQTQDDTIENAIPVCFECHAEIHSYNDQHPRGRKFTQNELRQHKDQWLKICAEKPEIILLATWDRDVGPLQALVDEMDFNKVVAREQKQGALFQNAQFNRAIQEGMISILLEDLKKSILAAYVTMSRYNQQLLAAMNEDVKTRQWSEANSKAREALIEAHPLIDSAYKDLSRFLASEGTDL
jgi:hypothetical protein